MRRASVRRVFKFSIVWTVIIGMSIDTAMACHRFAKRRSSRCCCSYVPIECAPVRSHCSQNYSPCPQVVHGFPAPESVTTNKPPVPPMEPPVIVDAVPENVDPPIPPVEVAPLLPIEPPVELPAEEPIVEEPQPEPPVEAVVEEPVEAVVEEPVEAVVEEPVEIPAEVSAEPPVEEPAEEPAEGGLDDLFGGDEPADEPAEEPAEGGLDDLFGGDEPADEPAEEPADEPTEEPAEDGLDDLFGAAPRAEELPMRTWVDNTGLFTTQGRLVVIQSDFVRLIKDNGNFTTVKMHRLSENDQAYVTRIAREVGTGEVSHLASR